MTRDGRSMSGRETDLLLSLFHSLGEEPWEDLAVWAMREDSPSLAALPAVCADFGLTFAKEAEDVCLQIALAGHFEEYVSSLDKKDRHELRSKLRKLPQAGDVELVGTCALPAGHSARPSLPLQHSSKSCLA